MRNERRRNVNVRNTKGMFTCSGKTVAHAMVKKSIFFIKIYLIKEIKFKKDLLGVLLFRDLKVNLA